jgi:hypothetical protein
MRSSKAEQRDVAEEWGLSELSLLADLGFGPASQLMTEPKLFVDPRFLAALQVEFDDELGSEGARTVLFQIGLMHGLRDALKVSDLEQADPGPLGLVSSSPLAMRFGVIESGPQGIELPGCWPDGHEAEAHLSRLGRTSERACALSAGYTSGWLSGTFDVDILAMETACSASGAKECTFHAREVEAWRQDASSSDVTLELLRHVSIPDLRAHVRRLSGTGAVTPTVAAERLPASPAGEDPSVHVWGPVIVMPFTDADTALATVEMLARDPSLKTIRVLVLDLGGAILDEGFGAAGLEQLIEDVEAWGADIILTGISPLSEDAVAGLEATHLLIRKDLPEAIAYAFQIAETHRHLL